MLGTCAIFFQEIEKGHIWEGRPAPQMGIAYWKLAADANMRDLILAVRADEACHSKVGGVAYNSRVRAWIEEASLVPAGLGRLRYLPLLFPHHHACSLRRSTTCCRSSSLGMRTRASQETTRCPRCRSRSGSVLFEMPVSRRIPWHACHMGHAICL